MAYTTIRFGGDYDPNAGAVSGAVIAARMTTAGAYPYTLGGVTLGTPDGSAIGPGSAAGWVTGDSEALRGRWRKPNGDGGIAVRIDVPAGDYRVILGSASSSYQRSRWRVLNNATPTPIDFSWASNTAFGDDDAPAADQWIDQNGVVRSIGADHLVATPTVVTISSGQLVVVNGSHASGAFSSDLSFIAFEPVSGGGGGGGGGGPVTSRRRRLMMS